MAEAAKIVMSVGDAPGAPVNGTVVLYAKSDNKFYVKTPSGTEYQVGIDFSNVNITGGTIDLGSRV